MIGPYNWDTHINLGEYILNVMARGNGEEIKYITQAYGGGEIAGVEEVLNRWLATKGHTPDDLQDLVQARKLDIERWKKMR